MQTIGLHSYRTSRKYSPPSACHFLRYFYFLQLYADVIHSAKERGYHGLNQIMNLVLLIESHHEASFANLTELWIQYYETSQIVKLITLIELWHWCHKADFVSQIESKRIKSNSEAGIVNWITS